MINVVAFTTISKINSIPTFKALAITQYGNFIGNQL
jgi:hypothetical protein